MTSPKRYASPAAFKVALEDCLRKRATARKVLFNRKRQRSVMERFLARVTATFGRAATLKGGLALELRLANARSTKDIDPRAVGDVELIYTRLQEAATQALGDHVAFTLVRDAEHPDFDDAVYEDRRFRVTARLAGEVYGSPFGADVGMGDPMHGAHDELVGEDLLGFEGIEPVRVTAYPAETHIAEKLHASTRPPTRPGRKDSRVRDLPDLALLVSVRDHDAATLRAALSLTLTVRATHPSRRRIRPSRSSLGRCWRGRRGRGIGRPSSGL